MVQLAGPVSNQLTMARPLLALTALGAGLGFVAPSVGRGLAPRSPPGTALGARALDGGSWAPLGLCAAAALAFGATSSRGIRSRVARAGKDEEAGEGEWRDAKTISGLTQSVGAGVVNNIEIAKILPHRYPFLLVDKVIHLEKMKRAVGIKNITANEPQFTGHFPDNPIMPGVLQVEALAQLAGVVCMQPGDQVLFAGIDGVKFRKPVVPGDTLVMEVEVKKFREKVGIAKITGAAFVDGQKVLEVKEFTCALVKDKS